MNKNIILGVLAVVVFLGGAIFILSRNTNNVQDSTQDKINTSESASTTTSVPKETVKPSSNTTPASAPVPTSFTMAQVQIHNSKSDCWSVVNGKVYNLTSWIGQHPGGQSAILSMCGKDGSAGFNDQHGGQKRPANELAGFFIGNLAN